MDGSNLSILNEPAEESSSRSAFFTHITTEYLHLSLSDSILTFLTRKAAHIFIYFVLGILVYNVVRSYGLSTRRAVLTSVAVVLSYAGFDEIHQTFVVDAAGKCAMSYWTRQPVPWA